MAFHTFGPLLVVDVRSLAPVVGAAVTVVDADTGEAVTPYGMGAAPAAVQLVTNPRGYVGQFQADAAHTHVRATVAAAGVDPVHLTAKEADATVAQAAADVLATRVQMLIGGSVEDGSLILTRYGGGTVDAGYVRGPAGPPGPPGPPGSGEGGAGSLSLIPDPARPGVFRTGGTAP
ncbi:hypothetical protein [Georgenia wangjunii]|uniref:hypothetical protein n=1 Tax=Georgenia wangjunii TaxID=3117730 RepID=UPI002F26AAF2